MDAQTKKSLITIIYFTRDKAHRTSKEQSHRKKELTIYLLIFLFLKHSIVAILMLLGFPTSL